MNSKYIDQYTPGAGTLELADLASSIIRMERPKTVIEVGCGYTTHVIQEALINSGTYVNDGTLTDGFLTGLTPLNLNFYVIDEKMRLDSTKLATAEFVHLELIKGRYQENMDRILERHERIDFAVFGCGDTEECSEWCRKYLKKCNCVAFLFTASADRPNTLDKIICETAFELGYEIFHVFEPHKKRQSGCTLVRQITTV
jgi:hypothetical protein